MTEQAKFQVGQLVDHKLFGYRGVVFSVDPAFMLSEQWYDRVAYSRPPRDQPWYHVLVDQACHSTYVAERNLAAAGNLQQIEHPWLGQFFNEFQHDHYVAREL